MKKHVVVTGATGFLGSRLTERLGQLAQFRVTATGRRPLPPEGLPAVSFRVGDLQNRQFTEGLLEGADVLVHCAALSSPWGRYADFYGANVVATENLLAAAQAAGVSRFIHISTPSIYFDFRDRLDICESDPLPDRMVNHYAATKLLAEQRVMNSGLEHIILRPRAIIGAGDTVIMPRLIRARKENRLRVVGNGQNQVDLTAVSNVVDAILLGIDAPQTALNQAYNITNGEPVPLWHYIREVLAGLDLPLPSGRLPYPLLYAMAGLSEVVARVRGREPAITLYGAGILAKTCTLNIDKARNLLGYSPRQTTREALNEFVTWYTTLNPCP